MKNFFKPQPKEKTLNRLEIVEEIHRKINSASDKSKAFTEEVMKRIDPAHAERIEKMAKLGFGKSSTIKDELKTVEEYKVSMEKAKIIRHYETMYPYKFILKEDMDAICKEYSLVLGPEKYYTGDLPTHAQNSILNFKLKEEDKLYWKGTAKIIEAGIEKSKAVFDKWEEITKDQYNHATDNGKNLIQNGKRTQYISNDDYFLIAAPQSKFQGENLVKEGNEMKEVFYVDDPAALKTVKYGFLVVALWGTEAAIEAMRNEKMN